MPAQFDDTTNRSAVTFRNTCSDCGQPLKEGERARCAVCMDAIWERLAAEDPEWYAIHKQFRR